MQPHGNWNPLRHLSGRETWTGYVYFQLGNLWRIRNCLPCWEVHYEAEHLGIGKKLLELTISWVLTEVFCLQGWRACYYGAGIIALFMAVLTGFLQEPERQAIGEETAPGNESKKVSIWNVILQPRVIMLCLAASVRHCGKYFI